MYLQIAVSTNPHFAKLTPEVFYPIKRACLNYASNGWYILKKTSRWKIIFNGSEPPPCALRVPGDLLGSLGCTH